MSAIIENTNNKITTKYYKSEIMYNSSQNMLLRNKMHISFAFYWIWINRRAEFIMHYLLAFL